MHKLDPEALKEAMRQYAAAVWADKERPPLIPDPPPDCVVGVIK